LPTIEEVKCFEGYEANSEGDDKLEFKDQKGRDRSRDTESSEDNKESSTGDTENANIGIKSGDPFPCLYCNKGYTTEKVLTMHYKKLHEKKVVKLEKKL
jgi:hypothetical protein